MTNWIFLFHFFLIRNALRNQSKVAKQFKILFALRPLKLLRQLKTNQNNSKDNDKTKSFKQAIKNIIKTCMDVEKYCIGQNRIHRCLDYAIDYRIEFTQLIS